MTIATEAEKFWDEAFKRIDLHGLLLDWGRDLLEAKYPTFVPVETKSTAMTLHKPTCTAMILRESYRGSNTPNLSGCVLSSGSSSRL